MPRPSGTPDPQDPIVRAAARKEGLSRAEIDLALKGVSVTRRFPRHPGEGDQAYVTRTVAAMRLAALYAVSVDGTAP